MRNYTPGIHWETDPGHGWLAVPRESCIVAGIMEKISAYSYQDINSDTIYLEEDCDAGLYLDAIKWKENRGEHEVIRDRYREHSFVRNLPSFQV